MMKHHQAIPARPESENSTQFRWVSGAIEPMKMGGVREMLRVREAGKAENAMHLSFVGDLVKIISMLCTRSVNFST
jgi:hypothetical protein